MARAEKKPILFQEKLKIPEEYLRFATPKEAANYRANKLKCQKICDLGAGVGGQTLAFAKKCRQVIAVEKDKNAFKILQKNIKKLKIKNVKLINGDALSEKVVQQIKEESPEIIFCDTERKEQGERSVKDLKPDVFEILEKYLDITKNIAIEAPPFTSDLNLIKDDFEKEFISLDGKLNRLTLYFNNLKKSDVSVVVLPSKERIENGAVKKILEVNSAKGFGYLYVFNPALVLAGLENQLASKYNSKIISLGNKKGMLSNEIIVSGFLEQYKILEFCENKFEKIISCLKNLEIGKVVLRGSVDPKQYWDARIKYEKNLDKTSKKTAHLFVCNKEAVLCEKE